MGLILKGAPSQGYTTIFPMRSKCLRDFWVVQTLPARHFYGAPFRFRAAKLLGTSNFRNLGSTARGVCLGLPLGGLGWLGENVNGNVCCKECKSKLIGKDFLVKRSKP